MVKLFSIFIAAFFCANHGAIAGPDEVATFHGLVEISRDNSSVLHSLLSGQTDANVPNVDFLAWNAGLQTHKVTFSDGDTRTVIFISATELAPNTKEVQWIMVQRDPNQQWDPITVKISLDRERLIYEGKGRFEIRKIESISFEDAFAWRPFHSGNEPGVRFLMRTAPQWKDAVSSICQRLLE